MQPILNIALRAARQFNEYVNLSIDRKEHSSTDLKEDLKLVRHLEEVLFKTLMDALKKGYPKHYVAEIGEQVSEVKEDLWLILGFDNEQHLLRKLPETAYSFIHKKNGKIHSAVIINPFTGAEYIAVKGGGAIFNDRRCRVTAHRNLEGALFATDASNQISKSSKDHLFSDLLTDLGQAGVQTRVSGCPTLDLAQVASGQMDAALLTNVNTADLEAAILLCAEAGALIGGLTDGMLKSGNKTLVAANPKLFKTTLQRFSSYGSKLAAD
jgi:myo-inositol-1(or 4)-monophosphatase